MAENRQGKITRFFSSRDRGAHHGPRKRQREDVKYLSDEKSKLKARLKLVGEETRAAYADLERQDTRVKASYTSTYMTTRCAPVPRSVDNATSTKISVIDCDTLDAALSLHTAAPQASIAVLNMASERHVGGGFLSGAPAQEESLCRRTTLYHCLMSVKDRCYPLGTTSVLVSPDILVFRTGLDDNFRLMATDDYFFVTVLSVAAIRNPKVHNDRFENHSDRQLTGNKVRETLRAAYHAGCRHLVLGALGCGAFHNPPKAVAEVFRDVLSEPEFRRSFDSIVFAIIDRKDVTYGKGQTRNCSTFQEVLRDLL